MRIYMQTRSDIAESPRFYQLSLQQDLLGGWTLYREWGQEGARSSLKQVKRGFRIVFSQGMDNSHAH